MRPSFAACCCRRRWPCSATGTGICRAGSTGCPGSGSANGPVPGRGLGPPRPEPGSAHVAELDQVAPRRLRGLLPVDVDARVELLHRVEGEVLLDPLDRLREVRSSPIRGLLARDEEDV